MVNNTADPQQMMFTLDACISSAISTCKTINTTVLSHNWTL